MNTICNSKAVLIRINVVAWIVIAGPSLKELLANPGGTLEWSTYLGGSQYEHIRDVITDSQGNVYLTGGTESSNFPVTPGAYQTVHNQGQNPDSQSIYKFDVFVTKLDPNGNMVWSTFIGGRNYDRAYAIELDSQGNVYVAGRAGNGFPVSAGAFQTTFMGGQEAAFYGPQDGFVAKLSPDGSTLLWASYFGTSDTVIVRDCAVDNNDDVYLASGYKSGTYPSTVANAFNNSYHGGQDAVVAKVKSDGSQVLWATYLGGSGFETYVNSIRIDSAGNLYNLASTSSTGIATPGAYDTTYAGGEDFFLAKLQPTDGSLIWATYLGGSQNEGLETHELTIDNQGNPIIAGGTQSTDFPTTPGAFDRTYNGSGGPGTGQNTNYPWDAQVSKISADGTQLLASTFVGGRFGEKAEGAAGVDLSGNVYLTGGTFSDNFPVTADAYQSTNPGNLNAFVVVLSPDLSQLLYASYLGGSNWDVCRTATVDANGTFYVAGETSSTNWPTLNPLQPTYGGAGDAMAAKFTFVVLPPVIADVIPNPDTVNAGTEYVEQLNLVQGTPPISWSLVQKPTGSQIDGNGRVSGWIPAIGDIGTSFNFQAQATNSLGSDLKGWQVLVKSRADYDNDNDVDQSDFGYFQACYSGPGVPPDTKCDDANLDNDEDVDLVDFGIFLGCMGGANHAPNC
ncbi:MAG: SBBP repeat-containing protein [Planctomycetota bacterium]|nr:MAG: SBBP repeat-containing protein [Planctomycetota bacterium]